MDGVITNNFGNASVLDLNNSNSITLDEPDLEQMRQDRLERTRSLMKTVDPVVTAEILPKTNNGSLEDSAAICIQAHFRGHLGRKLYCEQLFHHFEQEEIEREKKTVGQVEEGELLIENHRLQVQFDDNSTTRRNKERLYTTKVITIQRAWRTYQRHKHLGSCAAARSCDDHSRQPSEADDASDSSSVHPMSLSEGSDGELLPQVMSSIGGIAKHVIEAEPESIASDYSEMADFVKEHLANVHIVRKDDLETGNTQFPADRFTVEQKVPRQPGEMDDEYNKRLRKLNYLSLAQEFAELKKIDADALPFDRHCDRTLEDFSPTSDIEVDTSPSTMATPMESELPIIQLDNVDSDRLAGPPGVLTGRLAWTEGTSIGSGENNDVNRRDTDTNGLVSDRDKPVQQRANHHQRSGPSCCDNIADKSSCVSGSQSQSQSAPTGQHGSIMSEDIPLADEPDEESQCLAGVGTNAPGSGVMEFDVYNIETALPEMDWAKLEKQLELAAEEETKRKTRRNDREEIRRKLAMGFDEDYYGGERVNKKPSLQTRLQGGMNLQICFVNEAAMADQTEAGGAPQDTTEAAPAQSMMQSKAPSPPAGAVAPTVASAGTTQSTKKKKAVEDEDLIARQERLQAEATMALAQVRPMAHMQLEVEKQLRKKSPIAEIVGIPGVGDGKKVRFSCQRLEQMNAPRLQVILNDLHTQIENLNEELVQLLVERDDLHMEQDSKLVDIEDLTRRAQELSTRVNTHSGREKKKSKQKK